eukprot:CAMPEP_0205831042 /NCGR_PEP_ID=MMETSP0206-20130828/42883_1 /ASSEMBLY_ACC=CAM_ASM_000279 /TAXON_ID=36767 /ORGANISM="Euplotes focardii, Strain TN1" /LENGTH=155 /DNA_ID=CAMNT_0053135289 /DNA_START=28 /DNA_END=491 /DNA_ORIENTATION=-
MKILFLAAILGLCASETVINFEFAGMLDGLDAKSSSESSAVLQFATMAGDPPNSQNIAGGMAHLLRTDNGVGLKVMLMNQVPFSVFTVWIATYTNPDKCADYSMADNMGLGTCAFADIFNDNTDGDLGLGASFIVDKNGTGEVTSFIAPGEFSAG